MKYAYPEISGYIDFEDGMLHTLIIENPSFLCQILSDFQTQINGGSGKGIVSVADTPVNMAQYVEILDVFVPFDINRKNLLSKMVAAMEKAAVDPYHYEETMRFLRDAELYLDEIAFGFPCDIVFPRLSVGTFIKSAAPELRDDNVGICEKVLDYMELVCEFDRPKLFVTVNFRAFISDAEFDLFAKSAVSHGYRILMIESAAKRKIGIEKRLIIDEDLCEIG